MKIAVLSGKGGTGKTTISTNLALSIENSQYIDCDVEEPNGSIFLKPKLTEKFDVDVPVPSINLDLCTKCGDCAEACQFNAIAVILDKVLVFSELCHHCGACSIACKADAISEVNRNIGIIETNEDHSFFHGKLNIGEPIAIPILKSLKTKLADDRVTVLDCPPGASCTVVESVEDVDFCILVTEPTPFGVHDLDIAIKLIKIMELPFGVVINKSMAESTIINDYCKEKGIDILMEIPYSMEIAKAYSNGIMMIDQNNAFRIQFEKLYRNIAKVVKSREENSDS